MHAVSVTSLSAESGVMNAADSCKLVYPLVPMGMKCSFFSKNSAPIYKGPSERTNIKEKSNQIKLGAQMEITDSGFFFLILRSGICVLSAFYYLLLCKQGISVSH